MCFLTYKIDSEVYCLGYSFTRVHKCIEAYNYHSIQDISQVQKSIPWGYSFIVKSLPYP